MKDGVACDPYKNYSCLDTYLGDGVIERFFRVRRQPIRKLPLGASKGWPQNSSHHTARSLHGMADRCHHKHWRYAAQFSRQPLHERHRQHGCRQMAG